MEVKYKCKALIYPEIDQIKNNIKNLYYVKVTNQLSFEIIFKKRVLSRQVVNAQHQTLQGQSVSSKAWKYRIS